MTVDKFEETSEIEELPAEPTVPRVVDEYRKLQLEREHAKCARYYASHKDQIQERIHSNVVHCECGVQVYKKNYHKHVQSKSHIDKLNPLTFAQIEQKQQAQKLKQAAIMKQKINCPNCNSLIARSSMTYHRQSIHCRQAKLTPIDSDEWVADDESQCF